MSTPRERILTIDDEPQIRRFLRIALESQGYQVVEADTGYSGLAACAAQSPDLVLLDLGLPMLDGQSVLRQLRQWSRVPVIVLTVRFDESEKVAALDAGAHDYVTKPFGVKELLARIRAVLRAHAGLPADQPVLRLDGLSLDTVRREVQLDGDPVRMPKKEFELLQLLMTHAGRVLTHDFILRTLWPSTQERDPQLVRVYVGQLRARLGDDPARPRFIANEPGVGYRLLDNRP